MRYDTNNKKLNDFTRKSFNKKNKICLKIMAAIDL